MLNFFERLTSTIVSPAGLRVSTSVPVTGLTGYNKQVTQKGIS